MINTRSKQQKMLIIHVKFEFRRTSRKSDQTYVSFRIRKNEMYFQNALLNRKRLNKVQIKKNIDSLLFSNHLFRRLIELSDSKMFFDESLIKNIK